MKENKMYCVKIGELYLKDIYVYSDYPETNFIKNIELNAEYREIFTAEKMMSIRRILLELGIGEESITVEEYHEEYNTNE